jgi:hypothetical protein
MMHPARTYGMVQHKHTNATKQAIQRSSVPECGCMGRRDVAMKMMRESGDGDEAQSSTKEKTIWTLTLVPAGQTLRPAIHFH